MQRQRSTTVLALAIALIVGGLAVNLLLTGPLLDDIRRLRGERAATMKNVQQDLARGAEHRALGEELGLDPASAVEAPTTDPLVFLGRMLDESGLTRLELTTTATAESGRLQRTGFVVRAAGDYADILAFVRALESSRRVVTVDALQIETIVGTERQECRLLLSVHDVRAKVAS
jgi:hypothetical protein